MLPTSLPDRAHFRISQSFVGQAVLLLESRANGVTEYWSFSRPHPQPATLRLAMRARATRSGNGPTLPRQGLRLYRTIARLSNDSGGGQDSRHFTSERSVETLMLRGIAVTKDRSASFDPVSPAIRSGPFYRFCVLPESNWLLKALPYFQEKRRVFSALESKVFS